MSTNKQPRKVFLFGAGAAINWRGPKTDELTELVRESGFKMCDRDQYITDYLYHLLIENGYPKNKINFETIINVIEELIQHYQLNVDEDSNSQYTSIRQALFLSKIDDSIFNYSINGGEATHNYQLDIPKGKKYDSSARANNNETPHAFFLMHLLREIMTDINSRISKYAYHTYSNSVINHDSEVSKNFVEYMKRFSDNYILRMYTLNYDRVFKVLLEKKGISVFEGFECEESLKSYKKIPCDVSRILNDKNCHSHYNLHGSTFWEVAGFEETGYMNPQLYFVGCPTLNINYTFNFVNIEPNRPIVFSNIITGQNKTQKVNMTPFRQMAASFDDDCLTADELIIIGYSFGDEHLNQCIKTAIQYNNDLKITIVDPEFISKGTEKKFFYYFFNIIDAMLSKPKYISDNHKSYMGGRVQAYTLCFDKFLKKMTS